MLDYAHSHRLQFGQDLVFTFGPLGYLANRYFFPETAVESVIAVLLLTASFIAGIYRLSRQCLLPTQILLWVVVLYLCANIDPRFDLLLYTSLFCWGFACLKFDGRELLISCIVLALLFAFGTLVKGNFIFAGGLVAVFASIDLLARRQFINASIIASTSIVAFAIGWMICHQQTGNIPAYFSGVCQMVSGYDETMIVEGLPALLSRGLIILICVAFAIIFGASRSGLPPLRSAALGCWVLTLTWLIWKHGFTRAKPDHMGFFFGFAPLVSMLMAFQSRQSSSSRIAVASAMLACTITILTLEAWLLPGFWPSLLQPVKSLASNGISLCVFDHYQTEMTMAFDETKVRTFLSETLRRIDSGDVDVFGHDQSYAILSGLHYHPRPVFQSYSAYNRDLDKKNAVFYQSASAPPFVLFSLNPIDFRFPPLEDSMVLGNLLFCYESVFTEKHFLVLRKNRSPAPRKRMVAAGELPLDGKISLSDFPTNVLWLEIELHPSLPGRIKQLLYKGPHTRLAFFLSGSAKRITAFAPAPMLAAGFVANPLLLHTDDVRRFYEHRDAVTHPSAYSLSIESSDRKLWKSTFTYRLYTLEPSS